MRQNEPSAAFKAHLFRDDDVKAATPGGPDELRLDSRGVTDEPVESLCSRVSSYGPFRVVEYDDPDAIEDADEMCAICGWAWRRQRKEGED